MISVSGKKWTEKIINKNSVDKIKQDYGFSEILAKLIVSRKFNETEIFNIKNDIEINNKFISNKDYILASEILSNSIKNKEKICILGDYDVDGFSSTSLLVRFFKFIKHPYFYYIPDREKDGYGASKKLFEKLILKQPKLIIMVDCGSTSNKAVSFLNDNKIKSIIIDHHEINRPYPKSTVIINPKKNNGYSEYNYLCATTLTYFLLDIVNKKNKIKFELSNLLIYVLLATVCDVMPMRNLNRIITINVLKKFDIKKNILFDILFQLHKKKDKLTIDDLGYLIGPIINSSGRLGKPVLSAELLTSDDSEFVRRNSEILIKLNNKRKIIEKKILDKINFAKIKKENQNIIIYLNKNINEGLIGIIASRLKDYFGKPSIVITKSNNIFKGSARSTNDYNIGNIIKTLCDKKIIEKGGGHNLAAGFIIQEKNIIILDKFIQKDFYNKTSKLISTFNYDGELSSTAINLSFANEINKLQPFGNANQLPIFLFKKFKVIKSNIINSRHINAILKPAKGSTVNAISFNSVNTEIGNYLLSYKNDINVTAQINLNIYNNKKRLQLNIKDVFI
jgi:single-stranded-DNA-specific exonuclease|tara:strand:- start:12 stop:1706 length:1695 start_codon:yes stop_codon:yes gene_type:complete